MSISFKLYLKDKLTNNYLFDRALLDNILLLKQCHARVLIPIFNLFSLPSGFNVIDQ